MYKNTAIRLFKRVHTDNNYVEIEALLYCFLNHLLRESVHPNVSLEFQTHIRRLLTRKSVKVTTALTIIASCLRHA